VDAGADGVAAVDAGADGVAAVDAGASAAHRPNRAVGPNPAGG
jgi:hypothetical protein